MNRGEKIIAHVTI